MTHPSSPTRGARRVAQTVGMDGNFTWLGLARLIAEGPDLARVQQFADRIAAAIAAELG